MTASPAADWLPFDLEVARREPGRVRHIAYPDARCLWIKDGGIQGGGTVVFDNDWLVSVTAITLRLAPAQPAEGKWQSCDLHKPRKDGDVVDIRDTTTGFDAVGTWTNGHWYVSHTLDSLPGRVYRHETFDDLLHYAEWRYPPGERAETTKCTCGSLNYLHGNWCAINAAGQGGTSDQGIGGSPSATLPQTERVLPPAAPQRQNLVTQCWKCNETYLMVQRSCPNCLSANANHRFDLAQKQHEAKKPLPPLHRVTVERERIRFLLAYKGRIPMTGPPRVILSSLPVNAFKEWK